jgi:hypothetical protein
MYAVLVITIGFLSAVQVPSYVTNCGVEDAEGEDEEQEETGGKKDDDESDSDDDEPVEKKKKKKAKKEFVEEKKKKPTKEAGGPAQSRGLKGGQKTSSKKSTSFPAHYYNDRKDEWKGGDLSFLKGPQAE